MESPFSPPPGGSPYAGLQKRMLQNVQAAGVEAEIRAVVRNAFQAAVHAEGLKLSRAEQNRLFGQVLRQVLEAMLAGTRPALE